MKEDTEFAISKKASMDDYEKLMAERPVKFDQHASEYKKAKKDEPTCHECMHMFYRVLDNLGLCEIVRPVPEQEIKKDWRCKFQTKNEKEFPLYTG